MSHLTDLELVEGLEGSLPAGAAMHVRDCAACRDRLADLAHALVSTSQVEVPEPSPLFWGHLSARVREAIADDPRPVHHKWLAWAVLAPLGALALIVIALLSGVTRQEQSPAEVASADDVMLPDDEAIEAAWALTSNLIAMPDAGSALETELLVSLGSAELAALHLTPGEQAELVRLLQQELKVGG